jgi:HrpA-like RNA helicase
VLAPPEVISNWYYTDNDYDSDKLLTLANDHFALIQIVTSATLNAQKFSAYFNNCPIIRIPGRVYPVDLYHSKNKHVVSASGPTSKGYIMAAIDLAEKIHFEQEPGHILIFLTGN